MATITVSELAEARQECARTQSGVNYTKAQINAALQAVEDAMTTRVIGAGDLGSTITQIISAAINTATSPLVLTAAQKKLLFAWWAELKFRRDR